MKKKLLALLMGSSLVLAACGGGGDDAAEEKDTATDNGGETTTADAGDAAKLFEQKCSSCHGGDLTGGVGPDLTKIGSTKSQEDIAKIIENGQGSMPAGLLQGDEATQVAEWLAAKK